MISEKTFMEIAYIISLESKAVRRKVGAVIVKDNNIIALGYNGTPSGFDNNCEDRIITNANLKSVSAVSVGISVCHDNVEFKLKTKPEVLHAESNAIMKCSRSTSSSEGAEIYTTTAPCVECAKIIIQAGISKVYFADDYNSDAGLKLLVRAKIHVERIPLKIDLEKITISRDMTDREKKIFMDERMKVNPNSWGVVENEATCSMSGKGFCPYEEVKGFCKLESNCVNKIEKDEK